MTINVYRWDDASAPTCTGQVGSITTLLDAILVNGYGSKAAAGWAIAFTATNQRAYRPASGNRMYLAIDDTNPAPASLGANMARVTSYETMTSATAGTKPAPTPLQMANSPITGVGCILFKSQSADATQRPWIAYVSETFIHLHIFITNTITAGLYGILGTAYMGGLMWGDLVSQQKAGDAYATLLVAGFSASYSNSFTGATMGSASPLLGHYIQRPYHQFNTAIGVVKAAVNRGIVSVGTIGQGSDSPNFPDPITGGIEMSEMWVYEQVGTNTQVSARGRIPGLYNPLHQQVAMNGPFNVGDNIAGAGTYAGITYQLCNPGSNGYGLMQITGTW